MVVFQKMQWPGRTRAPFETVSEKNSVKPRDCCWGAGWGGFTSLGFGWTSIRSWQSELENLVCGLISPRVQDMLGTCRFVAVIIQACVVYCLVYSTMAGKFWWILRLNLQIVSTMVSWTRLKKVGSIDLYMGLWYGYTFEILPNLPFWKY